MGLADIVRSGVAVANTLTAGLQVTVSHYAWTGHDVYGAPTFAAAVSRSALVDMTRKLRRMPDGQESVAHAVITIVGPITANGGSNRQEPIDPRDKFTLPDGSTGPILDIKGLLDPSTNKPFMYEVVIGSTVSAQVTA